VKIILLNWVRTYTVWISAVLIFIAVFIAIIANLIVLPAGLIIIAFCLTLFRYWNSITTFDLWAVDEWVRTRSDAMGIRDWHAPYKAAELFCDPKLVAQRNEAAAQMNLIMMEIIKDTDHASAISAKNSDQRKREPFSGGSMKRNIDYEAFQIRHDQTNIVLSRQLLKPLIAGKLIAKGLPVIHDVTQSERIIPAARWRVMSLDIAKAEASGSGLNYIGVVIGKKN